MGKDVEDKKKELKEGRTGGGGREDEGKGQRHCEKMFQNSEISEKLRSKRRRQPMSPYSYGPLAALQTEEPL